MYALCGWSTLSAHYITIALNSWRRSSRVSQSFPFVLAPSPCDRVLLKCVGFANILWARMINNIFGIVFWINANREEATKGKTYRCDQIHICNGNVDDAGSFRQVWKNVVRGSMAASQRDPISYWAERPLLFLFISVIPPSFFNSLHGLFILYISSFPSLFLFPHFHMSCVAFSAPFDPDFPWHRILQYIGGCLVCCQSDCIF